MPRGAGWRRTTISIAALMRESPDAAEIFITARTSQLRPPKRASSPAKAGRTRPPADGAQEVFEAVADLLGACGARLFQERIFAAEPDLGAVLSGRADAYGDLDDGAPPCVLSVPEGPGGPVAGVQVHAVRGGTAPAVLRLGDEACGRSVRAGNYNYVALSGLSALEAGDGPTQTRAVFRKAEAALREAGGNIFSVVRTWLWLRDIASWYARFNRARSEFFRERGILGPDPALARLPASTGIGVRLAGGAWCGMDALAVVGGEAAIEYFGAAGRQQSACNYGSAFSRAARAPAPSGPAAYVSGTAAIDPAGETQHAGDARGQIAATLENAAAALADVGCRDSDVVQAIVYAKTTDVLALFQKEWPDLAWPHIAVLGDICREDLLFEIEMTAACGARRL